MSHRADEVRKRIAKRKRERGIMPPKHTESRQTSLFMSDEERHGGLYTPPSYEAGPGNNQSGHPLFRTEVFMFKVLCSAVLVLVTAIVFKNGSPMFNQAKSAITYSLEEEFQFAAVSTWYRDQFGEPLALFNFNDNGEKQTEEEPTKMAQLAVPASGKVLESFQDNGQGIMVETNKPSVEAISEGTIVEASEKPDTGLTIVLMHADGTKSWYGNLNKINVALYDFVEKGTELGKTKLSDENKGTYYFAIKKGDVFIDPIQVIQFE
ncbi:M23 family metallopeptidase [Bacillus weihaiensis]|uniref:M23 family metallopeptidase n=1 Tax=Bacillus weihaiensis TaxID=1547283 RepID=UPI002357A39A|nr:M23 family metallopeptidase [Bacillus weihaiensis]